MKFTKLEKTLIEYLIKHNDYWTQLNKKGIVGVSYLHCGKKTVESLFKKGIIEYNLCRPDCIRLSPNSHMHQSFTWNPDITQAPHHNKTSVLLSIRVVTNTEIFEGNCIQSEKQETVMGHYDKKRKKWIITGFGNSGLEVLGCEVTCKESDPTILAWTYIPDSFSPPNL